jgi:hypothetical protein
MIFDRKMLGNMFNITYPKNLDELNHPNEGVLLLVLFAFKFLITILTLAMNIPAGIYSVEAVTTNSKYTQMLIVR